MINLVIVLLFAGVQPSHGFAKAWFSCTTTSECVKTVAGCGRAGSINIKFKDKYDKFIKKTDSKSSCLQLAPETIKSDSKLIPICVKSQCELTNPT